MWSLSRSRTTEVRVFFDRAIRSSRIPQSCPRPRSRRAQARSQAPDRGCLQTVCDSLHLRGHNRTIGVRVLFERTTEVRERARLEPSPFLQRWGQTEIGVARRPARSMKARTPVSRSDRIRAIFSPFGRRPAEAAPFWDRGLGSDRGARLGRIGRSKKTRPTIARSIKDAERQQHTNRQVSEAKRKIPTGVLK